MVSLKSKLTKAGAPHSAEISVVKLLDILKEKGAPDKVLAYLLDKLSVQGVVVDGSTLAYREFHNLIMKPFQITEEEAKSRGVAYEP